MMWSILTAVSSILSLGHMPGKLDVPASATKSGQMRSDFLDAIFRGARFEGHELPLEVLQELSEYRSFVIDLAKTLFLRDNPARKRVPSGFSEQLNLALAKVGDGSAVATLTREESESLLPGCEAIDYFAKARDLIGETIEAANDGRLPPREFPPDFTRRFSAFGKRLDADETMELRPQGGASGPKLGVESRRRLLAGASEEMEVKFLGYARTVGAAVLPARQAKFEFPDGRLVTFDFPVSFEDTLLSALLNYQVTWLRVRGSVSKDRHDKVAKLTELESLDQVDEEQAADFDRVLRRLAELSSLESGWLDGEGAGLRAKDVGWVQNTLLLVLGETNLPMPGIFPTPEGSIQTEWSIGETNLTIVFDLSASQVEIEILDTRTGKEKSWVLDRRDEAQIVKSLDCIAQGTSNG